MAVLLNHTIVHATDPKAAAQFLADILGLPAPRPFAHFMVVQTGNAVSLDFMRSDGPISAQHSRRRARARTGLALAPALLSAASCAGAEATEVGVALASLRPSHHRIWARKGDSLGSLRSSVKL